MWVSGNSSRRAGIASRLDPPGHVEVEHEHVGVVPAHVAPRLVDVAGLRDDLELRLLVEQQPQPAADHRVIVGEHDADHRRRLLSVVPRRLSLGHR